MGVTVFAFVSDVGLSALCLFVFRFCSACVIIECFGQDDRLVVIALFGPVGWGRFIALFGRVGCGRFIRSFGPVGLGRFIAPPSSAGVGKRPSFHSGRRSRGASL